MGRAQWTRWGRGDCEGWSLDIGGLVGSAVKNVTKPAAVRWRASINTIDLGDFPAREEAKARAEAELRRRVGLITEAMVAGKSGVQSCRYEGT